MFADGIVSLTAQQLLVGSSIGLIAISFLIWQMYYLPTRRVADEQLSDGAVLLISDGVVQQASASAVKILGECQNQPIIRVLDDFFGVDATDARDAVNRLEMTGDPVDMLVHRANGHAYELIGEPAGGVIRLILRDAELLDVKLKDAAERISAADTALMAHQWEQVTLGGLIGEAPIIAWNRTAEGEVNWSGGEIKVRNSAIQAAQAVDLIVARTKLNRVPVLAGQPQKSRIEIVVNDGADTVSLHVLEIIRQDGTRIGFATDAGTAASAERTLTRFVQTMTETFAHLTVGLAIFDRNQTLALFNPALVQMWQVEPTWLARRPSLRDIIDELRSTRRLPELQDFHKWRSRILSLFENTEAADYEELWHLADGSNVRVLARPHPHGSLAFIFDDVTERVRLEQRYRHSIDLRRATLDRLQESVAVFGANGLLQFVNQAFHEIWGTDGESVYAAMHARQLIALCEKLTVDTNLWPRLHNFITGEDSRRAWSEKVQMGSGRRLAARVAPLPDGSTMVVFNDDIGAGAQAAVEDDPIGDVTAQIDQALETIRMLVSSPGQEGETTERAAGFADKLAEVRQGIEELATAGVKLPTAKVPDLHMQQVLQHAVDMLGDQAAASEIELRADSSGAPPQKLSCDPVRLRQVVFNLTSDALKISDPGKAVVLSGGGRGEEFVVEIAVTGTGVDVEDLETSQSLAIARRFAARDGGTITINTGTDERSLHFVSSFRPMIRSEEEAGQTRELDARNISMIGPKVAG